jgi:hypothetical protein
MANDTVEAARRAVIERFCDCADDPEPYETESVRRLDALIAAVRAENAPTPITTTGKHPPDTDALHTRAENAPRS